MDSGQLIVFEGPDGIGKSSLLEEVRAQLARSISTVKEASFPGRTPGSLGAIVYGLHHDPNRFGIAQINPIALQTLHIAAHMDSIQSTILPALNSGAVVLLDRFWWSTWVYGTAANVDATAIELLVQAEQVVWEGRLPDAVFLVTRSEAFRPEHPQDHFDRHLKLYLKLAARESGRYPVFSVENNDFKCAVDSILQILSGQLKPL